MTVVIIVVVCHLVLLILGLDLENSEEGGRLTTTPSQVNFFKNQSTVVSPCLQVCLISNFD